MSTENTSAKRDREFMEMAIKKGREGAESGAGGPFGAVVVDESGTVLAAAHNRVFVDTDPTAHAEVTAIRLAAAARRSSWLPGCTVYTSCEPCPMCYTACLWARIHRVCYAAAANDAQLANYNDGQFWADVGRRGNLPRYQTHADVPAAMNIEQLKDAQIVDKAAQMLRTNNGCKY